jgi:AraC family transcriptional regulator
MRSTDLLCVLRDIRHRLDGDVSLGRLAKRAGWSPFHLHRAFRRALHETPKQYTQRLRLECAAAALLASGSSVTQVARSSGFASHEVFTRAFRRHFGRTPAQYREHAPAGASRIQLARHAKLTASVGPCVHLFHFPTSVRGPTMATLSITRQERAAQPILFIRRRVARSELQGMLAECFGKLYGYAQRAGLPLAGFPLARYVSTGPGLWTVEAAVPLTTPSPGEDDMQSGSLPAGPVALGVHAGPYEGLADTHAAIDRWIESNGYRAAGAPWEWYVTDPGEYPNPADWKTEVYWPLEK